MIKQRRAKVGFREIVKGIGNCISGKYDQEVIDKVIFWDKDKQTGNELQKKIFITRLLIFIPKNNFIYNFLYNTFLIYNYQFLLQFL